MFDGICCFKKLKRVAATIIWVVVPGLTMHNWNHSIQKALKHRLYRCSMLANSHNPDYLFAHASEVREFAKDGTSKECKKRLLEEQDKRYKNAFQIVTGPKVEKLNRAR